MLACEHLAQWRKLAVQFHIINILLVLVQDAQAKQNTGYSLHQLQGNKAHGTERSGVLYKRSEG